MAVNVLPPVGRIQGLARSPDADPATISVTLQYTDHKDEWHEVAMPFLDAMYLLNLLRAMQEDVGFYLPDDPYSPQRP